MPNPLRIAIVTEQFIPEAGGAERSAAQIVELLVARGHAITILAGRYPRDFRWPGVTPLRAPLGRPRGIVPLAGFAMWARRRLDHGFDASLSITTAVPAAVLEPRAGLVVQSQDRAAARRRTQAGRLLRALGTRLDPRQQLLRQLERRTLRDPRVRRIVAISRYVAGDLKRYYEIPDERIELIPNAAEMPAVDPAQRADWRRQVRAGFNIAADEPVALFPAIDPWRKGIEPLMHAVKRFVDADRPLTVLVAGTLDYGAQCLVARLGVRDRVRFVGPTQHMPALYVAADVTVLPTFHDAASKVVLESLMLATPAISTRYNGSSDFIAPPGGPERGRVLDDPADVDALVGAITDLLDPQERARCAAATAGLAAELTMTRHVDRLEQVLRDVAGERRAAAPAAR
ncbi:MAG: glycosyltransferase family 4 protein [Phycisphaeraceae bacterium]